MPKTGRPRKKILLVTHNFPPESYGGVEIYTCNMAKALAARGYAVSVLYPEKAARDAVEAVEEGSFEAIRLHKLSVHPPSLIKTYGVLDFKTNKYCLEVTNPNTERLFEALLDREEIDLVHFQHLGVMLPFSLPRIAKAKGPRVCMTLHDAWLICPRTQLYIGETHSICDGPESVEKCTKCLLLGCWPVRKSAISRMLALRQSYARELLRELDVVSVPSRYLANVFVRNGFGVKPLIVSPLGIHPVGRSGRKEMSDTLRIGCFGSISEVKNTLFLVEAFKQVKGNAQLILSGNGRRKFIDRVVRSAAGDARIEYRGPYTPDRLPEMFSEVDLAIVPSVIESFSLVVRESLSAGVPVIASAVGGIPEIIEHMRNGILFDPYDKYDLARRLQSLVDEPSLVKRLREGITPPKTMDQDADEWSFRYEALISPAS